MAATGRNRLLIVVATVAGLAAAGAIGFAFGDRLSDETPSPAPLATPTIAEETPSPAMPYPREFECSSTSATVGDAPPLVPELGEDVNRTRTWILDGALRCDLDALEELALEGEGGFAYSFGVEKSPAKFWRMLEKLPESQLGGPKPMEALVAILNLSYCEEHVPTPSGDERIIYAWPSVQCADRTDEDWDALEDLYSKKQVRQMREFDLYLGYRAGITEDGDWIYFIAGD